MRRLVLILTVFFAATAFAQAFEFPHPYDSPTPFFLPRAAYLQGYFAGKFAPSFRLQWEWTAAQESVDAFVFVFEAGAGYGVSLPGGLGEAGDAKMTSLYEYPLLLGVGYRGTYKNGFHWGVTLSGGPLIYGATYNRSLLPEHNVVGFAEGKAQFGWKLGPVIAGVHIGVGQPWFYPLNIWSTIWVGGPFAGVFIDWR